MTIMESSYRADCVQCRAIRRPCHAHRPSVELSRRKRIELSLAATRRALASYRRSAAEGYGASYEIGRALAEIASYERELSGLA